MQKSLAPKVPTVWRKITRIELQKELQRLEGAGDVRSFIAGEDWRMSNEKTWELLKRYAEWKRDSDLGKNNKGISIVVL